MRSFLILIALAQIFGQISAAYREPAYHAKIHQDENHHCTIISFEQVRRVFLHSRGEDELEIEVRQATQPMTDAMIQVEDKSKVIEIYGRKKEVIEAHVEALCKTKETLPEINLLETKAEIEKIVDNGDQSNRIDVVFMGDGYTQNERQQFFDDMDRLTAEMFEGVTFRSWLPVFNIWAIFEPSVESGIGYNGPKNTAFRLYRQGGQLRAIFTQNAQYARQICAMTGQSGCDYPSLIGNDNFYGGLGGEFVISTKSNRTGTVVLRHEMGHNFVNVGEEYDNGQVYRGVNSASSVASLGWSHWLSGARREERAMYRILQYPWIDLGRGAWTYSFSSDGQFSRWYMQVSVSAAGEEDSLEFTLDGRILPWTTRGFEDREFYSWYGDEGLTQGLHTFSVRSKTTPTNPDIPRMICSVNLHEFGPESEFVESNDYVSAYPTWDISGRKTFRPTNAGCLMRNMTHEHFCDICKEGMWYQFLQRISLIDSLTLNPGNANPDGTRNVTLATIRLGQLRDPSNIVEGEHLGVTWFLGNVEQPQFEDQFEIALTPGSWRATVNLDSPEIRNDPNGLTEDTATLTVPV